jgi:hypothetical protein
MTLPASGNPISFSQMQSEFGGTNPISMSEYYAGGAYVSSMVSGIPTSGQISHSQFLGKQVYGSQRGIFAFGSAYSVGTYSNRTNLVSNVGVVATDGSGIGAGRQALAGATYGTDKAIFGFGKSSSGSSGDTAITNLVSNLGVLATDTAGVGTARFMLAASSYGGDKAIFAFGTRSAYSDVSTTNLVSNVGVVATDSNITGTARYGPSASRYGGDKSILAYGGTSLPYGWSNISNLISNTGVVASDTTGVGTSRQSLAAVPYGSDRAIFAYGNGYPGTPGTFLSMSNLVSNTGVIATDTTGVGTARYRLAATQYGGNKGIFGYGSSGVSSYQSMTNLVSDTGVIATDTTGVGTERFWLAGSGYST